MKKLFIGMIIGSLITCGVFYFLDLKSQNDEKENVKTLLESIERKEVANKKMNEAINDSNATLIAHSPLTIIVTATDELYYYREKDCNKIEKINAASISEILEEEKNRKKEDDLMIYIKTVEGADFKKSINLLDAIGRAGIQPGHYAEINLSEKEKNCIKNYKKN
ncbi:MAG: hypothetical protein ABIO04_01205 [Ferruginibacter sp.]